MKYARARVALSPTVGCPSNPIPATSNRRTLHLGHARTLLLGSLLAQKFACPFHVRFDGPPFEQGGGEVGDRGEAIFDAVECLDFLGVRADLLYWTPPRMPHETWLRDRLGDRYAVFEAAVNSPGCCPEYYQAQLVDDVLVHAPSLIVRGMEFKDRRYFAGSLSNTGTDAHVSVENLLYAAAGEARHEFNVPMVTADRAKMSKSLLNGVHWTCLTSVPGPEARSYLLATLACPSDPLRSLDMEVDLDALDPAPHAWSWPTWGHFIRERSSR